MSKTLEQYLYDAYSTGLIDHALRVDIDIDGEASFYIHPMNADGETLDFVVRANAVTPNLPSDREKVPGPFGGPELLEQARALCQAIERLPAGEHQTNLISKVADATFALQNLQSTGDYFWPRLIVPATDDLTQFLEQTDFAAAEQVASSTVDNQQPLPPGEDDCESCKI